MATAKQEQQLQAEKVYQLFKENPLAWGMYYFPHHFRDKSPNFHLKILIESMKCQHFAVAAPRGSAKSTILTFLKVAHKIAFKKTHFTVICQNTFDKAASSIETIKMEWRENKRLMKDFPIKISKDKIGDSVFEHRDGHKCKLLGKGAEQIGAVRGVKFGAYRPDYILIDDLEDDIMVRSPEGRENMRDLYDNALIKAVDENNFEVDCIGTILHDDCLIARLVSLNHYLGYRKLLYRAKNKNKKTGEWFSLWPEKWSLDKLESMEKDNPTSFAQEMQNDPVSGLLAKFKREDFRYWYIENDDYVLLDSEGHIVSRGQLSHCKAAIGNDLAWEEKKESDSTVIMGVYLTPNSEILVDKYLCEKGVQPDQFEEYIFTMEAKYKAITGKSVPIGFEKAMLEKVMKWLLRKAMQKRNHYLWFKDVLWVKDKITRIVTRLQARYKQNSIYHRKGMGDLEHQLLRVPSGTHDDLPDALQCAVQLLNYEPKKPKTQVKSEDEGFDFMRSLIIKQKNGPPKKQFMFGKRKTPISQLPGKVTWGGPTT